MKRVWSFVAWISFVLVCVLVLAVAIAWTALPLDGITLTLDGESFSLAHLGGGEVAVAFLVAVVATFAGLLVAVLATVLGLALGALGIGVGVCAAAATLALLASPLVLVGWLLWRALRRSPRAVAAPAAA